VTPALPVRIPLLSNGDAYYIDVTESSRFNELVITAIDCFPNNLNVRPYRVSFMDLDQQTRRAVIEQVNRRFEGRMVKV